MPSLLEQVAAMERRAQQAAARRAAEEEAMLAVVQASAPEPAPQASDGDASRPERAYGPAWRRHAAFTRQVFPHNYGYRLSRLRGTAPAYHLPEWEDLNDNCVAVPDPCACPWEPEPRQVDGCLWGHSLTQPVPDTMPDCPAWGGVATLAEAEAIRREHAQAVAADEVAADVRMALEHYGEPLAADEVAVLTGLDVESVEAALRGLWAAGVVARQPTREEPVWVARRWPVR